MINNYRKLRLSCSLSLASFWLLLAVAQADVTEVAFSFTRGQTGGIAQVRVDSATGKILDQRVVFQSRDCPRPKKVRRTADGQTLLVTNESPEGPHLFLVHLQEEPDKLLPIKLSAVPDEVRCTGQFALVTCDDESLVLVNLTDGKLVRTWDAKCELSPPGNHPQDVFILPGASKAVVSFQKDSKKGKRFGSRLALVSLPRLKTLADIRLPRNRPELHIDGNLQQQGPAPEIVLVSESANTLMATLDLYGAVALIDWSEAQAGRLASCTYLPTSFDGTWGNAFPDRATAMELAGRQYALVCNAGEQGGAVLVDLAARRLVCKWRVPPGLEAPVFIPRLRQAFSVCSGKTKRRIGADVEKSYHPGPGIYRFDFRSASHVQGAEVKTLALDYLAFVLTCVDAQGSPLLLLAAGKEHPDTLIVYDPRRQCITDQQRAVGVVRRFER